MIQFMIAVAVFLIVAPILLFLPFLLVTGLLFSYPILTLVGLALLAGLWAIWDRVQYGGSRRY